MLINCLYPGWSAEADVITLIKWPIKVKMKIRHHFRPCMLILTCEIKHSRIMICISIENINVFSKSVFFVIHGLSFTNQLRFYLPMTTIFSGTFMFAPPKPFTPRPDPSENPRVSGIRIFVEISAVNCGS